MEDKMEKQQKPNSKKIFISLTITVTLILTLVFFLESRLEHDTRKKPTLKKYVHVLPTSQIITNNLSKNKSNILSNLNNELNQTKQVIDTEIDKLFEPVFDNIDNFLDSHYSVFGEYENLGTTVFGDINQMVADKLFKEDFHTKFKKHSLVIIKAHKTHIIDHVDNLHKYALNGVDLTKNKMAIKNLKAEIDTSISDQTNKLTKLADTVSKKVAKTISAEISTNSFAKSATKTGIKAAANSVTAGTGAVAAGILCGPFAWVCSPIAAGVIMFSTDAVVLAGDELLTRDNFKKEIIDVLNTNKQRLKNGFIRASTRSIKKISKQIIEKYKQI